MICRVCPHNCRIEEDQSGFCQARVSNKGQIIDRTFGYISAICMDPIEKKPLYHYYPSQEILSVGFFGCNLHCPFCQNHSISQRIPGEAKKISPERLVDTALEKNSFGIAYTYSEPLIHYEYLLECAALARKNGLKNILITNGMINPEPADKLLELIDGANIDLKSINPEFYHKELKGDLDSVLNFISQSFKKIHLEITTLIIPGKNDSPKEVEKIASFIAGLDETIPLHLSAYYPQYKYSIAPTNPKELIKLVQTAKSILPYVYPGNIKQGEHNTNCLNCGATLIERNRYNIRIKNLAGGQCTSCNQPSDIITP